MEPRHHRSCQSSKIYKRRSNCDSEVKNVSGKSTSGYVDGNGKLLLEVQVTESLCADMSTRSSNANDNVNEEKGHLEVTIVRPLTRGISVNATNINGNVASAMKILDPVEEQNPDPWTLEKSDKKIAQTSKLTSAPPVAHFFNYQRQKSKFDTLDESNDEPKLPTKMNNDRESNIQNFHSVEMKNLSNERTGPLIELGALHKILDRLRPDDLESTSAWYSSEPCCREIVQRFQNLLCEWATDRKRLDQCLALDRTLTKCQNCGVIKCSDNLPVRENIVEGKENEKMSPERENDRKLDNPATTTLRSWRKMEILRNSHPVVSSRCRSDVATREKVTSKINRIPVSTKVSAKGTGTTDRKMINRSIEKNTLKNSTKKKESEIHENTRIIRTSKNPHNFIEKSQMTDEKCVEVSYDKSIDTGQEKYVALMDTMKYLARGNFDLTEDDKSKNLSEKTTLLERSCLQESKNERKHNFTLHGSRDVDFYQNSNFFLTNRSTLDRENVTKSRMKRKEETVILDSFNTSCESVNFSQHNDGKLKLNESDTSTFSSSSAENLIRQWMKSGSNVEPEVNLGRTIKPENENFTCEIRTDSSVNNVRTIRAQIAEAIQKFANRSALSKDDINGEPEGKNPSGSFAETLKIESTQPSTKNRSKIANTTGIGRYSKGDDELRGMSKKVSNTIWDGNTEDYVPISVTNSTELISKMTDKNSMSALTVMSSRSFNCQNLSIENSERFERQIIYDQISSRDAVSQESLTAAASKVLLTYRKILESNEEMDWESFEQLVTALHPSQRELWCDICKAVSNEAKRVADETGATTEVCIEINPRACGDKKGTVRSRDDEITFELDMTLQDVRAILATNEQPVASKERKEIK